MAVSCTNLQVIYDDTDYSSGRCIFRWRGAISNLDHFEVLPMYYSVKQNIWVQEDSSSSADVWGVDGWYQHHWTAPNASVASLVKFYVRPVTTWTDSDGKSHTSNGDWSLSGEVKNPRWIADQDEQRDYKYKCITDRPDKPTMAVEANAAKTSVTLKFSTEAPRAGAIEVQRRMDGGSWAFLHLIERTFPKGNAGENAPFNDQPRWPETGTLNYADSTMQPGHTYEYRARVRNMATGYSQNGTNGRLRFNAPINGGSIRGREGDFCDAESVTTKPARPTFHEAKLSGPQSVRLLWVENGKNTDHYDVQYSSYRSDDNHNAWNAGAYNEISHMNVPYPAPKLTVDGKSYSVATVSGLSYGTLYDFRVYCVNADGDEAVSIFTGSDGKSYGTRSVRVPAEPAPTVTAPKSVSAKFVSPDIARISWSSALEQDATFSVEHSLRSDAWDLNIDSLIDKADTTGGSETARVYSWAELEKGKTHYFRVYKVFGSARVMGTPGTVKVDVPAQSLDSTKNPTNFRGSVVNGNARLTWGGKALGDGESYQLQYSSDPLAFTDNVLDSISEATLDESTGTSHVLTVTSLDEGTTYWFRVRWRSDSSASQWVTGVKLEIPPSAETLEQLSAPTVSTTNMSYMLDEQVPLGWTHNSGDDTDQSAWQVQLGGSVSRTIDSDAETASNPAIVLDLSDPTYGLSDGDFVTWKVRTQGAWPGYWSPWSRTQAFDVYARPVATMSVAPNPVTSFPMTIEVGAVSQGGGSLPTGNRPLSCSVSITPVDAMEMPNPDGTTRTVAAGEAIWSGYYTNAEAYEEGSGWAIPLDASDVALSGAVQYRAFATVTTMQGMRCETSADFTCEWDAEVPAPRANVAFDSESLSCRIYPWCDEFLGVDPGTGEMTFQLREGTELSVYRVNQDGSTELVAADVPNDGESYVDDPHCAFGTCTYRIVARDAETGVQGSDDYQVETAYDRVVVEFGAEQVELKYNIEWTEEHAPDVELLNFHGRKHPVAHWGTQRGQTFLVRGSLIRGTDAGTLSKLRRLAEHRGACYVREPTGLAWWANVVPRTVSGGYSTAEQKVELEITRIEA